MTDSPKTSEPVAVPSWAAAFLPAADRVLYPLTLGITVVVWAGGSFRPRYPFMEGYLAVLTAYAAQRESAKWLGVQDTAVRLRRGELYVGLWVATWLALTAICNLNPRFAMPTELLRIMLSVLGVFAVSSVSSGLRQRTKESRLDVRQALMDLLSRKQPISALDASRELGISRTTTWRMLETLVKEGLVIQDNNAALRDRRYNLKK